MATLMIRWLLSIFLLSVPPKLAAKGPPVPPSRPVCFQPCSEQACSGNIHCTWDHSPDTTVLNNYSLHWQLNGVEKNVTSGVQLNGIILRDHAPGNEELLVWAQARNQFGSAKSEALYISNVDDIIKPPSPELSLSHHDPLEFQWSTACDRLQFSIGSCEARHQTVEDRIWLEPESGLHGSYTFSDSRPGTVYEFQVRCSCNIGLMSDWSESLRMKSGELAPIGEVNVWGDCGEFDCYVAWKDLPSSQARGAILGYVVTIHYRNGTLAQFNESTTGPSNHSVYDAKKWCLTSALKTVSSVSVSAYNAIGTTLPTYLQMPLKGTEEIDVTLHLNMNEENLTVWWDLPPQFSTNLKEYVLQYKEAGRPVGRSFDWMRVNKSQVVEFTGPFLNYTAYKVSLFKITHSNEVQHVKSVIGYSVEKAPPAVPYFEVSSIEETEVSVSWEPSPLTEQNGLILNYQIGVNAEQVHSVTATLQKYALQDLHPGQTYEVWIRAVNAAGPGPNVTRAFTTKHHKDFVKEILWVIGLCCAVVCSFLVVKTLHHLIEKVPDPRNSHIFQQLPHQMNEPLIRTYISISEPNPTISELKVVERQSQATDLDEITKPGVCDGPSQMDCQNDRDTSVSEEHDKTGSRTGRKDYSEMVDSDEDCCSSEEDQFTSGYEQHFMPTAVEILDI